MPDLDRMVDLKGLRSIERYGNRIELNCGIGRIDPSVDTMLQSQPESYILNVASTAGFQPGPFMAVYYATKAFVLHFSEALSVELREDNISVTAHCPGATESEFAKCCWQ